MSLVGPILRPALVESLKPALSQGGLPWAPGGGALPPHDVVVDNRITEASDNRITEGGDLRILE